MNNSIPDKLSTICDPLFQKAVDEAIKQHRINGESIAQGENGKVKIVNSEERCVRIFPDSKIPRH